MVDPAVALETVIAGIESGSLAPYLGPGVLALGTTTVPTSAPALCAALEAAVRVPRRATGNVWAVAQYIESRKFRGTLDALMADAFAAPVRGNPIHDWLARTGPQLIVDTWYDDGLMAALAAAQGVSWGWVQGVSQTTGNGLTFEGWTRAFAADGRQLEGGPDSAWRTLLYKPHGLARKGSSFLLSDADYVEVLTEIDIQTPIPALVKNRRAGLGFVFIGCRFDDQMLRIFARQIMKRSQGPHYALLPGAITRMEARFLEQAGITRIDAGPEALAERLAVIA